MHGAELGSGVVNRAKVRAFQATLGLATEIAHFLRLLIDLGRFLPRPARLVDPLFRIVGLDEQDFFAGQKGQGRGAFRC